MKAAGILAVAVIYFSGCGPLTPRQTEEPFAILTRQKLEAQKAVKLLKKDHDAGSPEYQEGRRMYQKARDAYAKWIAQVQSDLYYGHKLGEDTYNESLTMPVASGYDFIRYAKKFGPMPEPPNAEHAGPAAANMAAALLRIWNTHRISPKSRQDLIVKKFEDLKWPSFESAA